MSYGVRHIHGSSDDTPELDRLGDLYDELQEADEEYFDVSVTHEESGYVITAYESGYVLLDNMAAIDKPVEYMHIDGVTREQVIDMWRTLATGNIKSILALPWRPGRPERLR
jgi:hypothetical protein